MEAGDNPIGPLALPDVEARAAYISRRVRALVIEHGFDDDRSWIENEVRKGEIIPYEMHSCSPQCRTLPPQEHKAYKVLWAQQMCLLHIERQIQGRIEELRLAEASAKHSFDVRRQAIQLLLERTENRG